MTFVAGTLGYDLVYMDLLVVVFCCNLICVRDRRRFSESIRYDTIRNTLFTNSGHNTWYRAIIP